MRVFFRRAVIAVAAAWMLLIVDAGSFGQSAFAQRWIDVKTGKQVPSGPAGGAEVSFDRRTAFNPRTGQNYAREADGCWIDVKTGKQVPTTPLGGAEVSFDRKTAFNPRTGQNYALEPCKQPSQTTAQPTTPQIGMVIEPNIGVGLGGSSGSPTYTSTGAQPPFSGDSSNTNGQVCGGATFYPGFAVGPARVGLDVNVCSGSNTFGSGDTLFRIPRHGPGDVNLKASTNVIIDVLFKGEVPVTNNVFFSAGIGPTFRELDLTLTSDQSFFGGGVPSISESTWQTGLGASAGLSTFVCPACIAGNPLKLGVEGRARWFSSESIGLRSPVFGFTETGTTGRTTDYSVLFTASVPVSISDIRVKRDIVQLARLDNGIGLYRYRYNWSDQLYVGVMAQEVAKVVPAAVALAPDGYLRVDYGKLGMRLQTWDEWAR